MVESLFEVLGGAYQALVSVTGFGSKQAADIGAGTFLLALLISLLTSQYTALLYSRFYESRGTGSLVHRSFLLLGPSITAIFICVQFSLPLSLGLLGALSIIRFRTPIKEPEEVGFIMVNIATAICCATLNIVILALFLGVITAGLAVAHRFRRGRVARRSGTAVIAYPSTGREADAALLPALRDSLPELTVASISGDGERRTIIATFARSDETLVQRLTTLASGVAPSAEINVYFDHAAQ
mgnify:CR=1 FL=1